MWPIAERQRNDYEKPGQLHARCVVIDDNAIISNANLTDDAFNRNMELGILLHHGPIPRKLIEYFKESDPAARVL